MNAKAPTARDVPEETDLGGSIYQLTRLMRGYWNECAAALELSGPQSIVLAGLQRLGDGVNQTELARDLGIHKAPLACIIDQLQDMNYLERRPDPRDRRMRRIFATEKAREIIPRMSLVRDGLNASLTHGLTDAEIRTTQHSIDLMRGNLMALMGDRAYSGLLSEFI